MAHVTDWRPELMTAHPRLFEVMRDEPHLSFGYPYIQEGWRDVIERLCGRIEDALRDGETFEFVRIKQKMGILRADWDADASEETEAEIGHALDLAVARSACTCEICGREGRLYNNMGALGTRCAEHAAGDPVPPRYGSDRIRRQRRWRGQADVYYASYDRQTDTLTEVPPPSRDKGMTMAEFRCRLRPARHLGL